MLNLSVKRIWLMVALFALVTATGASTAWQLAGPDRSPGSGALLAQGEEELPDPDCPPGQRECPFGGEGNQQAEGGEGEGGEGGGTCTFTRGVLSAALGAQETIEIPCYLPGPGWYGGNSCYYGDGPGLMEAPPPPDGKTAADGRWYWETCFGDIQLFNGEWILIGVTADIDWEWFDFEDVPTVSPEELAWRVIAVVGLDGVEFQLAPPETGAALVSLPVWLGVAETPNAWGPIEDGPECDGGVCVWIRAEVSEVSWDMGDGTPAFPCQRDQHQPWQQGVDDFLTPGDRCHHDYHRASRGQPDGRYEITTTSTWSVEYWSNTGVEGDLTTTRDSSTSLQVDEIQVLTGS